MPVFKMLPNVGPHFYKDKWYQPGDTIEQKDESGLPKGKFAKLTKKQEGPEIPPEEKDPENPPVPGLVMEEVDGGFNVVNPDSGKAINDKPLSLSEAKKFMRKEPDGDR